ncbi:MAG: hypothetical protein C4547_10350 [Phycisphaerales bacterium]|nr:MAG: hypothetical protein C4547_10350 [Phycisphaerales bacterium]
MWRRWLSRVWLAFLGVCTVTACASVALTVVARTSNLQERWLSGDGASSVPRFGYSGDGVVHAGMSLPFGGEARTTRRWRWRQTGAELTCNSTSLQGDQYVCDRDTLALSAPTPLLASLSAIFPVFAFLNGPATRYVRRRLGRCPHCGRLPDDVRPPCRTCETLKQGAGHGPGSTRCP